MNSVTYFPEQRHQLRMTTIRRERLLPPDAVGEIEYQQGDRVELRGVIARAVIPSRYVIIEAAAHFRLRRPDELPALMQVSTGDAVAAGDVLAQRGGRKLAAPANGILAYIGEGRIIVQETPEPIEMEAGMEGTVVEVRPGRGVVIETVGAVLQGVWGNGRSRIGVLKHEPPDGLETIYGNQIDIGYRGAIVVTRRQLRAASLEVIAAQGFSGVIAPSMDAALLEQAQALEAAVLLVQGFGTTRLSPFVVKFLEEMEGRQATLDAAVSGRFDARRPEAIISVPVRAGLRPPPPERSLTLAVGMDVRLTRGSYEGIVGTVVHLPRSPVLLDNGLRLPCAQVRLVSNETIFVPLANLEVFGQ